MNKDQIKGVSKDIAGKIQEGTGKVVGNKNLQVKGIKKQIDGETQKARGDIKEAIKDAVDH